MKTLTSVLAIIATFATVQYGVGYLTTRSDLSSLERTCGESCARFEARSLLEQTERRPILSAGYRDAAREYLAQQP